MPILFYLLGNAIPAAHEARPQEAKVLVKGEVMAELSLSMEDVQAMPLPLIQGSCNPGKGARP